MGIGEVTLDEDCYERICKADIAYEALTEKQKEEVEHNRILLEAKMQYEQLLKENAQQIEDAAAEISRRQEIYETILQYVKRNTIKKTSNTGAIKYYYELRVDNNVLVCRYAKDNLTYYMDITVPLDAETYSIVVFDKNLNVTYEGKNPEANASYMTVDNVFNRVMNVVEVSFKSNASSYYGGSSKFAERIPEEAYTLISTINDELRASSCEYTLEDIGVIIK